MSDRFVRSCLVAAGILGAGGIAAAAAASHGGGTEILGPLSLVALTQAPAVVALALYGGNRWIDAAVVLIALGALVFCGDLALHYALGASPIAITAPISGAAMIAGWLLLIPGALFWRRR